MPGMQKFFTNELAKHRDNALHYRAQAERSSQENNPNAARMDWSNAARYWYFVEKAAITNKEMRDEAGKQKEFCMKHAELMCPRADLNGRPAP